MQQNKLLPMTAIAFALSCSQSAHALNIHGFASQGFSYSEGNNWFGKSDGKLSTDNTQLGVSMFDQINPNLSLAAQGLIQKTSSDNAEASLDYLRANYHLYRNQQGDTVNLVLGRIKNNIGLYNSSRDVPSAHDFTLLPQSIYIDRNRELLLSSDGVGISYSKMSNQWNHQVNLQGGCPNLSSDKVRIGLLTESIKGDLSCKPSFNIQYMAEDMNHGYKLGLSYVKATMEFSSDMPGIEDGSIMIDYWVASAQKAYEQLTLTAEYGLRHMRYHNFGAYFNDYVLPATDFWSQSTYLQAEYAFTSHLRAYARYDVYYTNKADKSGDQAQAFYSGTQGIPNHYFYSKMQTLGLAHNLTENWLLKAEYKRIDGRAVLPYVDNTATGSEAITDLYVLTAHYLF